MVHFHLSLSGCGMRSLETCTHIISRPKTYLFISAAETYYYYYFIPLLFYYQGYGVGFKQTIHTKTPAHSSRDIVMGSEQPIHIKLCFHLSLSGCGTGSLETSTHVILMPKSHNYHPKRFFFQMAFQPVALTKM